MCLGLLEALRREALGRPRGGSSVRLRPCSDDTASDLLRGRFYRGPGLVDRTPATSRPRRRALGGGRARRRPQPRAGDRSTTPCRARGAGGRLRCRPRRRPGPALRDRRARGLRRASGRECARRRAVGSFRPRSFRTRSPTSARRVTSGTPAGARPTRRRARRGVMDRRNRARDDVFTDTPDALWSAVLRRKGGACSASSRGDASGPFAKLAPLSCITLLVSPRRRSHDAVWDRVGALATEFTGALLQPGDTGVHQARRIHNGLIDKRPALIAPCRSVAHVGTRRRLRQGMSGSQQVFTTRRAATTSPAAPARGRCHDRPGRQRGRSRSTRSVARLVLRVETPNGAQRRDGRARACGTRRRDIDHRSSPD